MATRSEIRFATRQEGQSFSEHPSAIHARFYAHWDGYPEYRGVEVAESILVGQKIDSWEIESLTANHTDLEYIYYVWQAPGKETFISIFERDDYSEKSWELSNQNDYFKCIFVGMPKALIDKYKQNTDKDG